MWKKETRAEKGKEPHYDKVTDEIPTSFYKEEIRRRRRRRRRRKMSK
jgi:hypothetical protein